MVFEDIPSQPASPQMALELVFPSAYAAAHLDRDLCKDILLKNKAIYKVEFLKQPNQIVLEASVWIDLSIPTCHDLVKTFEAFIQHAPQLGIFYAAYYIHNNGAVGDFTWSRPKDIYHIRHRSTIIDNWDEYPPPMSLLSNTSHILADKHYTNFIIQPTLDPNEVLIAPY